MYIHVHVSQFGLTALMWAVKKGYSDTVTVLLEAGANTNTQENVSTQFLLETESKM